ncbi:MAG: hypothetical protein MRJ92_12130 [Nitrospira sp.]|nr:hypothetical protein [Nitrospira sp.]
MLQTVGNLHLYEFYVPQDVAIGADLSVTLLLGEESEPTEGIILCQDGPRLVLQVFDAIDMVPSATLVPDTSGLALTASRRLAEMSKAGSSYTLGPAERLLPILEVGGQSGDRGALQAMTPTSVLTPPLARTI